MKRASEVAHLWAEAGRPKLPGGRYSAAARKILQAWDRSDIRLWPLSASAVDAQAIDGTRHEPSFPAPEHIAPELGARFWEYLPEETEE